MTDFTQGMICLSVLVSVPLGIGLRFGWVWRARYEAGIKPPFFILPPFILTVAHHVWAIVTRIVEETDHDG